MADISANSTTASEVKMILWEVYVPNLVPKDEYMKELIIRGTATEWWITCLMVLIVIFFTGVVVINCCCIPRDNDEKLHEQIEECRNQRNRMMESMRNRASKNIKNRNQSGVSNKQSRKQREAPQQASDSCRQKADKKTKWCGRRYSTP